MVIGGDRKITLVSLRYLDKGRKNTIRKKKKIPRFQIRKSGLSNRGETEFFRSPVTITSSPVSRATRTGRERLRFGFAKS